MTHIPYLFNSHLSPETIDDGSSLTQNNESNGVLITSPSTLRVKLKKPVLNGNADHNDEEYIKYKMPEKI